ncbi:MAG: hypothetical protein QOK38_2761 [Acidobacteriaceae bacterium]|jgi:hypothetical protein|nr:hypothetical protein [Acidobacteriaceae bacterium]
MSLRRRVRRAWPASRLSDGQHRRALRVAAGVLLLLFLPLPFATAQQQLPLPQLQRRRQALEESGIFPPGRSNLPDEAAGAYALSTNPAEVIEMILNGDGNDVRLQGYLTRLGDGESDQGAPLTYFFARTTVSPTQLTFITRQVHGLWWSFAGTIDRGSAQMSTQKGYYFLNGTLTEHFDTGQSQPQRVRLPLLPEGGSTQ